MSRAITCEELVKAVHDNTFIKGGEENCAEGVKYDFRMSSRVLKASKGRPVDMNKLSETELTEMVIEPGEVVFVLTEESLDLPKNVMAHLVPKRKLGHEGIIVLGGFCVDPLYKGRLLVGLFNYSSSSWALDPKRKLIAAMFFELQENEIGTMPVPKDAIEDFPSDLRRTIAAYQPIDVRGLKEEIKSLENHIDALREEFTTDKEWKKDFQTKLATQTENIDKLIKGLEEEKDNRVAAEKSINKEIGDIKVLQGQNATRQTGNNTILVAVLSVVITFILTALLTVGAVWLAFRTTQSAPPNQTSSESQQAPTSGPQ